MLRIGRRQFGAQCLQRPFLADNFIKRSWPQHGHNGFRNAAFFHFFQFFIFFAHRRRLAAFFIPQHLQTNVAQVFLMALFHLLVYFFLNAVFDALFRQHVRQQILNILQSSRSFLPWRGILQGRIVKNQTFQTQQPLFKALRLHQRQHAHFSRLNDQLLLADQRSIGAVQHQKLPFLRRLLFRHFFFMQNTL